MGRGSLLPEENPIQPLSKTSDPMRSKYDLGLTMLLMAASTASMAQSVGSACGCPDLSVRPTKNFSTMTDGSGNMPLSRTLSCDTIYVLNQKSWVGDGADLYIQP